MSNDQAAARAIAIHIETDQADMLDTAARCRAGLTTIGALAEDESAVVILTFMDDHIELRDGTGKMSPLVVDFLDGTSAHRAQSWGRKQLLPRAVGVPTRAEAPDYHIVDTTAGLGGDSYGLAQLGCSVTAIERHPVMTVLLRDGLRRATVAGDDAASRITFIEGDASNWLADAATSANRIDAVVIDPMFPDLGGSALVKKQMQLTRLVVGADHDSDALLDAALGARPRRVVVKRHPHAPHLADRQPDWQVNGKAVRFDVYRGRD